MKLLSNLIHTLPTPNLTITFSLSQTPSMRIYFVNSIFLLNLKLVNCWVMALVFNWYNMNLLNCSQNVLGFFLIFVNKYFGFIHITMMAPLCIICFSQQNAPRVFSLACIFAKFVYYTFYCCLKFGWKKYPY